MLRLDKLLDCRDEHNHKHAQPQKGAMLMVDDSLCSLFEQVMILVIWSGQRSSSLSACTIKDNFDLTSAFHHLVGTPLVHLRPDRGFRGYHLRQELRMQLST